MPNLPMHIYVCQQVAIDLDWGYVHDHPGAAYLGSTTPDIRAMTKWDRARTHFSDLSVTHVGAGVEKMFTLHPHLAGSNNGLSPQTRSFLLGYVSHLVADETWITTMFRPHFAPDSRVTDTEIESPHLGPRSPARHGSGGSRRKRPPCRRKRRHRRDGSDAGSAIPAG